MCKTPKLMCTTYIAKILKDMHMTVIIIVLSESGFYNS